MTENASKLDVAIVGAGISGLIAARVLHHAGLSLAVLEARERIGGRLLSIDSLDLGATWFWPNEPRIQKLISELGLATHPQYLAGDAVFHAPQGTSRLAGNPIDVASGRLVGGLEGLAHAIAETLPKNMIRLSSPVHEIRRDSDGIEAQTPTENIVARHLVLALPPALAVERIRFSPNLPEKVSAIASRTPVWMAAMTKIVAHYRKPFWRRAGLAGAAISHIGPMREIHDTSGPDGEPAALFGFMPSPEDGAPEDGAPKVTEEQIVGQLVELFGAEAGDPVQVLIQDWQTEAFTSPSGASRLTSYELFGHPVYESSTWEGRLHWASTETSLESPGHVEGALAAADRVCRRILGAIGRDPIGSAAT